MKSSDKNTEASAPSTRPSLLQPSSGSAGSDAAPTRVLDAVARRASVSPAAVPASGGRRHGWALAAVGGLLLGGVALAASMSWWLSEPQAVEATAQDLIRYAPPRAGVAVAPASAVAAVVAESASVALASVGAAPAAPSAPGSAASAVSVAGLVALGAATVSPSAQAMGATPLAVQPEEPTSSERGKRRSRSKDKREHSDRQVASAELRNKTSADRRRDDDATSTRKQKRKASRDVTTAAGTASAQAPKSRDPAASATAKRGTHEADADAELVAAIMARMDRPTRRSTVAQAASPREASTIAELVQRCKARTEKSEARACRRRICEGYWGRAEACPKSLAPKKSNSKKTANG